MTVASGIEESPRHGSLRLGFSLILFLVLGSICLGTRPSQAQSLSPAAAPAPSTRVQAEDCADGVVKDDGTIETGYGWVPSVIDGSYVQEFTVEELQSGRLLEVCICWTRTRPDDEVDFKLEVYPDVRGRPALQPSFSLAVTARAVPDFPDGAFTTVDLSAYDVEVPSWTFYVGVRWDASIDQYFFVCVDRSEHTPVIDGFLIEELSDEWTSFLESQDPSFEEHRAMFVRLTGDPTRAFSIPTLGPLALVFLITALATVAVLTLRR